MKRNKNTCRDPPNCHRHGSTCTRSNDVAKNVVLLALERKRLCEPHDGGFSSAILSNRGETTVASTAAATHIGLSKVTI